MNTLTLVRLVRGTVLALSIVMVIGVMVVIFKTKSKKTLVIMSMVVIIEIMMTGNIAKYYLEFNPYKKEKTVMMMKYGTHDCIYLNDGRCEICGELMHVH